MTEEITSSTDKPAGAALLERILERGRVGHAYLFSGDDLFELEDAAIRFAQTVNCERPVRSRPDGPPVTPCGKCSPCRRIGSRNHPDVLWARPENKTRVINVEATREIGRSLSLRPLEAQRKAAILVAADRLNSQGANAFLKTLEEPPGGSLIVLLTTEPDRVLETLVSRCLRVSFGSGQVRLAGPVAAWVGEFAGLAESSTPDLLSRYRLLGSLAAALTAARAEVERRMGAASPLNQHPDADPQVRERWEDELNAAIEAEYRGRRADFLKGLETWLRDVWLCSLGLSSDLALLPQLAAATAAVGRRVPPEDAERNLAAMELTQRRLYSNVQEALALEVGLMRLTL